jgi:hypothetical protein
MDSKESQQNTLNHLPHPVPAIDQDIDQIRLLAIFHYVLAGILGLISCFPIIHIIIGTLIVTGAFNSQQPGSQPPPALGWIFILIPAFMILTGFCTAIAVLLAARSLSTKRRHTFCVVVAALECLFMPLGTILGVLTILVLMRESVKIKFNAV